MQAIFNELKNQKVKTYAFQFCYLQGDSRQYHILFICYLAIQILFYLIICKIYIQKSVKNQSLQNFHSTPSIWSSLLKVTMVLAKRPLKLMKPGAVSDFEYANKNKEESNPEEPRYFRTYIFCQDLWFLSIAFSDALLYKFQAQTLERPGKMPKKELKRTQMTHHQQKETRQTDLWGQESLIQPTAFSTKLISQNAPKVPEQQKRPLEQLHKKNRPWTTQEELQLAALMKEKGPDWDNFALHFEGRQGEEIKTHCLLQLKKVINKITATKRKWRAEIQNKSTFRDLKKLIEEGTVLMSKQNMTSLEARDLFSKMLTYQSIESSSDSDVREQHRQLDQLLHDFKRIMKKMRPRPTSKAVLKCQDNSNEIGYESDCSSVFQSQEYEVPSPTPCVSKSESLIQLTTLNTRKETNGSLIVSQQNDIRALLMQQGLLQFEQPGQEGQLGWEIISESDEPRSVTHHCFYNQDQLQGDSSWKRVLRRDSQNEGEEENGHI